MVMHDLNLAARYAHHMIALKDGKVIAAGAPAELMTAEMLRNIFGIEAHIMSDPRHGSPMCIAYASP
jgi:iron complex transport system ATP-binding protein